jgi:hypothetical protein
MEPCSAVGLTKNGAVPDFEALYAGTPDSSWFVRHEELFLFIIL